jgi:hypothetical protein
VRLELIQQLKKRAIANSAAVQEGKLPDLRPLETAGEIELNYIAGSALESSDLSI